MTPGSAGTWPASAPGTMRTILVAGLSLILAGCNSLEDLAASATELHFTTSPGTPGNPAPNVDVIVTDKAEVVSLFEATIAQPVVPPGVYECRLDTGVSYQLAFTSGSTVTDIDLDPTGCGWLTFPDGGPGRAPSAAYWSQLAQTLGVAESVILP